MPEQVPLPENHVHPFSERHVLLLVADEHSAGVPLQAVPDHVQPG